jgi:hypothetical protein
VPGHHGTRADWADSIEHEGFVPAPKGEDWFGDGSYFFEDAPWLAKEWAEMKYPGHETCIFEAEISLARCLDLLDGVGPEKLRPFYDRLIQLRGRESIRQLKQKQNLESYGDFDCQVINLACETMAEDGEVVDVVRGACAVGDPLFAEDSEDLPRSRFASREHIQLAVRNNSAILTFQRAD